MVLLIYANPTSLKVSQTQPVYGPQPITYSPFPHIDSLYYKKIESHIYVDQTKDLDNYNLTICRASCPLKVVTSHSQVKGICPKDRFYHNCYVNLLGYQDPGLNSQYYSRYMLTHSKVTFTITNLSQAEPVQLCITTDKGTCGQIFTKTSTGVTDCQEVLAFNKVNNYTDTFTAHKDSYYCAVWILTGSQSINYIINSTLRSYDIQTPHSKCANYRKSEKVTFDLGDRRDGIATQHHEVCILVQENGKELYNNITIVTTAVNSLDNIFFIPGIVSLVLSFTMITALVVTIIVSFQCKVFNS